MRRAVTTDLRQRDTLTMVIFNIELETKLDKPRIERKRSAFTYTHEVETK